MVVIALLRNVHDSLREKKRKRKEKKKEYQL
jgi:hypothetical protein